MPLLQHLGWDPRRARPSLPRKVGLDRSWLGGGANESSQAAEDRVAANMLGLALLDELEDRRLAPVWLRLEDRKRLEVRRQELAGQGPVSLSVLGVKG